MSEAGRCEGKVSIKWQRFVSYEKRCQDTGYVMTCFKSDDLHRLSNQPRNPESQILNVTPNILRMKGWWVPMCLNHGR